MVVIRFTGHVLFVIGVIFLARDLLVGSELGEMMFVAFGELWFSIHPPSLNALQAFVQRYVLPELWDMVFAPLLSMPGWLILMVVGGVMAMLARRRKQPDMLVSDEPPQR